MGVRALDKGEQELLRGLGARVFTMSEIDRVGIATDSYFEHICREGFGRRLETIRALENQGRLRHPIVEYEQRLSREISMIQQMKFPGYFLIVWDFNRYAREHKVPYFGICLGMQTMVIEYARNVCGLERADSTEFDPATPHRVIFKLRELKGVDELGGTMRLGAWPCVLAEGSFAQRAYGVKEISERHRHRYEFNREYEETLKAAGLKITGETPDQTYVEICEIGDHPWAGMNVELSLVAAHMRSSEAAEGLRAFAEKRKPVFNAP